MSFLRNWLYWIETSSCSLWRHCNAKYLYNTQLQHTYTYISYIYIYMCVCCNWPCYNKDTWHYNDVIMGTMATQFTSLTIVYSTVYWGTDQRKHQSSASLAFVRGIYRRPVNSPHKGPVTRKIFPFDGVIIVWPIFSRVTRFTQVWLNYLFYIDANDIENIVFNKYCYGLFEQ